MNIFITLNEMNCPICNSKNTLKSGYYIGFTAGYMGYESHCESCKNMDTLHLIPNLISFFIFISLLILGILYILFYLNPRYENQCWVMFFLLILMWFVLYHFILFSLSKTKGFQKYIKNSIINEYKRRGRQSTDIDEIINERYKQKFHTSTKRKK